MCALGTPLGSTVWSKYVFDAGLQQKLGVMVLVRSPRFEPGSSAWQADVLDQTRLRPQCNEAKIISLLLNLKSLEKADLAIESVSNRLKFFAKHADLNDADGVNWFIARKQYLVSYKDSLAKAAWHD